jgi:hypothetical protein
MYNFINFLESDNCPSIVNLVLSHLQTYFNKNVNVRFY